MHIKYLVAGCVLLSLAWSISAQEVNTSTVVERITTKIEWAIHVKWESYREKYIRALTKLKKKYTWNATILAIIDAVIERLKDPSIGEMDDLIGSELGRTGAVVTPVQPTPVPVPVPPAPTQPTPAPTIPPTPTPTHPAVGSCPIFPADNSWNQDISGLKVHPNSANYMTYIKNLSGNQFLHADFWGNGEYGIPFVTVGKDQKKVPINFTDYGDESDPGPYPIPDNAPVEWGNSSDGDRHVIVVDQNACMLYELYNAHKTQTGWDASSAAKYDLRSNALRPDYWTSADAAWLPIFPGLARYDEASKNEIRHALRVTFSKTQRGFIHPATHYASSIKDANALPMGLKLRLKADFDTSKYTGEARAILEALKKYGLIVADNGSNWFITGASDTRWNDDNLNQLKKVPGSAFEAVYTGEIIK